MVQAVKGVHRKCKTEEKDTPGPRMLNISSCCSSDSNKSHPASVQIQIRPVRFSQELIMLNLLAVMIPGTQQGQLGAFPQKLNWE